MRKHFLILFILFEFFTHNIATACKCYFRNFKDESDNSDLIFKGFVINKNSMNGKVFYTFRLSQTWKGQSSKNIIIETNSGGQACGQTFTFDSEYVVYSNNLTTSRCSRNSLASTCADIARLNYKYSISFQKDIAVDASPILSKSEGDYFNTLFINISDTAYRINFTNKKVAFYYGKIMTKKEFFEQYGSIEAPIGFEKFSEKEIKQSGGYSGIISFHRKMRFSKRAKKKIIEQLSK